VGRLAKEKRGGVKGDREAGGGQCKESLSAVGVGGVCGKKQIMEVKFKKINTQNKYKEILNLKCCDGD